MKVSNTLATLFLERVPPVPAMNKWVASYPMLCWVVLGRLCHRVMLRVWQQGVLSLPGLQEEPEEEGGGGAAQEAAEVGRDDNEAAFRRLRAKRAKRIAEWMGSEVRQLWSLASLWITQPLACELGQYLADEYMYPPQQTREDQNLNHWLAADAPTRPPPTLRSFMADGMLSFRQVQCNIASLISNASPDSQKIISFLQQAFPQSSVADITGPLQQMTLETMGDLHLRFTVTYDAFPFRLLRLLDNTLQEDERRALATEYMQLPQCCKVPHFDGVLLAHFSGVDALLSAPCLEFLAAFADNYTMITKVVEFGHRQVGGHAKSKGPAKPSEFQHVADSYITGRISVLHNEATNKKRKARPKITQHPRMKVVKENLKKKPGSARTGIGGNPKYAYLNARRLELQKENLSKQEFNLRVADYASEYDASDLIQQAARDDWCAQRLRRLRALDSDFHVDNAAADPAEPEGFGAWRAGDDFWPVGEDRLLGFVGSLSTHGGMRPIAEGHRQWQSSALVLTGSMATAAAGVDNSRPLRTNCNHKHPGKCIDYNHSHHISTTANAIVQSLHGIKYSDRKTLRGWSHPLVIPPTHPPGPLPDPTPPP